MILRQENNLHLNAPKTYLTHNEAAGTTALRWKNANAFQASWAVQVGELESEQSEVLLLSTSAPAGTAGTFTTSSVYPHSVETPVYAIKYNQVVFEVSTSGTSGTATPITDGTVTYQPDGSVTVFDHTAGSPSYGYRTYFRNSVSGSTSIESDWITSAGLDFYSLGRIRERVKGKMQNSKFVTDEELNDWINECKDIMVNQAIVTNEDYSLGTTQVAFGTDGLGTVTTTDFNQLRKVEITYDGVNTYLSTKMNINDFLPGQTFNTTHPYHAWRGDNVFVVQPAGPGTASLTYYQFGTTMVNDTDVLPLPMRGFTHVFVNYAKANALSKDQKSSESEILMRRVDGQIGDFISSLSPRDKSSETLVDLVEPISGGEYV